MSLRYRYSDKSLKARYPAEIHLIVEHVPQFIKILKLDDWAITVVFDKTCPDDEKDTDSPGSAETEAEPEYRRATVKFYLETMSDHETAAEQFNTIIHEMCHVLLSPLTAPIHRIANDQNKKLLEYLEEAMVTHLASMTIWAEVT